MTDATAPLPNDPASRTADGTIKDQAAPITNTTPLTPTTTEVKPADATTPANKQPEPAPGTTLLTEPDKPAEPVGAPEKYEPFTAPEGYVLAEAIATEAGGIFKELNLPQASAQRLVDFYNKQMIAAAKAPMEAVQTMREGWRADVAADKDLGPKLPQIRVNLGRAKDLLGPELKASFNAAMDLTGAGDHPAFIKAFNKFAELLIEGQHVGGSGPSAHGQKPNGAAEPKSVARSIYPNLP